MNIRFYNARILTMEEGKKVFEGELWVKKEKIIFVGTKEEAGKYFETHASEMLVWDEEIDCNKNLLMPTFKNAHTHSAMTLMRSRADDLPLNDWLNKQIFPVEAKMTGEDIYYLTKLAILEYVSGGMSACFDMYLTPYTVADACREAGFRCVQVSAINNFSQTPELVEEWFNNINGKDPFNSYIIGCHAEYTCSEELLLKLSDLIHKYKSPFFSHMSETKAEHDGCIERHGMTPVQYFDSLGMFDFGGGGYHLVWADDKDIEIMADKGLYAVSNPGSNTKLASGIAPISDFVKRGVPVALGTDGPASNNSLDMFKEMFLVTGLAKLRDMDASSVDAINVLKMATVNGAHAMGLKDCDILAEGKLADIVMIDMTQPEMHPINNIEKNLVYAGCKQDVKMTMIHGDIKYRDGIFNIGVSPDELYDRAEMIKARIDKELEQ
ncbi:MAG: amidohydrolase [Butyrivibrio sp.]|nr:amidohydrolase [Butyrivibrio sp.]